jgi:protein TonB
LPPALPSAGALGGIPGGVPGGLIGGVIGGILYAVPSPVPPPPPPSKPVTEASAPAPKPSEPIHVVGDVEAARLISAPQLTYPPLAKVGRVRGLVRLDATIGKDGRIENLKVVSRNPLLINAAVNAVKQWVYRPTYLNGRAVQVATEIDVHFQMTDRYAN